MFRGVGVFNYGNLGIGLALIEKNTIILKTNFLLNIKENVNFNTIVKNKVNFSEIKILVNIENLSFKTNFLPQIRKNIKFELTNVII
jgi:hypothetical protein